MFEMDQVFQHRTSVVPLGEAPDGLPMRLLIDRGPSAAELLEPVAQRLGYQGGNYAGTAFEGVVRQVNDLFRSAEVQTIRVGNQDVECFVCALPARTILGPTLLERMLGESSRTIVPASITVRPPTVPAPPPIPPTAIPLRPDIGTGYLSFPLNQALPLVVRKIAATFVFGHFYEAEALPYLATARFELHLPYSGEHYTGSFSDRTTYRAARLRELSTDQPGKLVCSVDRVEAVRIVVALARQLEALHCTGEIHGDVKPANTLIVASGVRAIDGLHLTPGQTSPAMTPGWAAPEQITGAPVSFATDQYPLGVILCRLLQAVMYGEEVSYSIPVSGGRLERFTFLRNPGAYLDPSQGTLPASGIAAWRALLDRCLRYRPEDRFASMAELTAQLEETAAGHPPLGTCAVDAVFGQLSAAPELAWQLASLSPAFPPPPQLPFYERT